MLCNSQEYNQLKYYVFLLKMYLFTFAVVKKKQKYTGVTDANALITP